MSEPPVRRQPLLAVPGWLLFVCLFLPTLRVCDDPMMPLQFPPSYAVYLGGMVVAILATSTVLRSRRRAFTVLYTLWTATMLTILALFCAGGSGSVILGVILGILCLFIQIKLTLAMLKTDWSERAMAIGCFIHGLIATGWSSLLAFDKDGMWGGYVAVAAGVGMMIVAAGMIRRAHEEMVRLRMENEPAQLPQARAIIRD
jgi:hypothetical protein